MLSDAELDFVMVDPLLITRFPATILNVPAVRFKAFVTVTTELIVAEVPILDLFMVSVFNWLPTANVKGDV